MNCLFYDLHLFVVCCVPGIAPFHVEVCVDGDREILVRHLRYKRNNFSKCLQSFIPLSLILFIKDKPRLWIMD
jgi:hypothetical protein